MSATSDSRRVSSATLWSVVDFVSDFGIRFAVVVVLARLLSPEEFGTVALLAIFVGIGTALVDGGFGSALIQRQDITEEDRSTAFWLCGASSFAVAAAFMISAPAIAGFFDDPILIPLAQILALSVAAGAFGIVQRALLTKRLEFRLQMYANLASSLISGGVAIWMAIEGYGVFALAVQSLVSTLVSTGAFWLLCDWRPKLIFCPYSVRRLFGFGGYLLLAGLLGTMYSRAYTLLIGKFYSPAELGQFVRAETAASMMSNLIVTPMSRVAFPRFSELSNDPGRLTGGVQSALTGTMLLNAPAMLGLAAVAEPFVLTVFGSQWEPAIPLIQILCLGGLLMPLHVVNLQGLMARGRSDLFFRFEIEKKIVGLAILAISAIHGPVGIAWGTVVVGMAAVWINARRSADILGYGMMDQIRDVAPHVAMAAAVAIVAGAAVHASDSLAEPLRLIIGIASGTLAFFVVSLVFSIRGLEEIRLILVSWRSGSNSRFERRR